ncbi:MAG: efflux RND transporter periplasmic adaptor subunit [Bacteroidales bacterium]|nr:efflux RND transporter periplasmic adaptor subunit [Bacteroidales bacterium]
MKSIRLFPIIALLTVVATGCNQQNQAGRLAGTDAELTNEKEIVVRTQALELSTIARTIDYTATIEAFEEVHLAPASPGRVDNIFVEPGDRVSEGQKLFAMDQTQLHQAEIQLGNLKTDLQRLSSLLETGDIPQQQYDQLKTQVEVTESNVKFLRENTVIYAPFSGVVTGKYFENGEMYSGAPNTVAGKAAIVTLMQVNPVKAVVNISEQYMPLVKEGMDATIISDVFPDDKFKGTVSLVYPTIDPMTRSFEVEITVPNSNFKLKPGMFIRVSMFLGEEEAFVVPSNVVLQQEGTNNRYIFVDRNGIAKRYQVKIGKRYDEMLEIISDDLAVGDMLVVDGQTKLTDNDKINVVN